MFSREMKHQDFSNYTENPDCKTSFCGSFLTETDKQYISAEELRPDGHFVSTSDSQTSSQCLDREGVAVSVVEWVLPPSLENRTL